MTRFSSAEKDHGTGRTNLDYIGHSGKSETLAKQSFSLAANIAHFGAHHWYDHRLFLNIIVTRKRGLKRFVKWTTRFVQLKIELQIFETHLQFVTQRGYGRVRIGTGEGELEGVLSLV